MANNETGWEYDASTKTYRGPSGVAGHQHPDDLTRLLSLETSRTTDEAAIALFNLKVFAITNPIDGASNPGITAPFKLQAGTTVATTSAAGVVTVTFPTAFTTGLVTVVACQGDDTVTDAITDTHGGTKTSFEIRAYHGATGAACNALLMRFNWIAIGW